MNQDDRPSAARRLFHHFTFYGFALCFAATCVATFYHYVWNWPAPYRWFDLPVVLGTLGGIGLVLWGTSGLAVEKSRQAGRDPRPAGRRRGMEGRAPSWRCCGSFGASGLLAAGACAIPRRWVVLLALHLGIVFGLFVTMPFGKFVHGFYRKRQPAQTCRRAAGAGLTG